MALDVVVVGSGPNGLAAAIACARAGLATRIVEAAATPGGGARTGERTLPGVLHDICSTVHPLAIASPWFRELDLGIDWVQPPAALAHVLRDGRAITLERSIDDTAAQLGRDATAYTKLVTPFVEHFETLAEMVLGPLRPPKAPLLFARFGLAGLRSMRGLARAWFRDDPPCALLAGIAAHSMVPLEAAGTAAFALVLACAAHAVGWPLARGGSRAIIDALVRRFGELGGELVVGERIASFAQLPPARAYLFDVTPRQLLAIAGDRLPDRYRRKLARFRYGPGVFKLDWALRGPIPWRDPRCARAATVHLSGSARDVAAAERSVHAGIVPDHPFTLVVQPTLFDPSRAPAGVHVAWAYCHVPHGSAIDATRAIEDHIERCAPGFRDLVIARAPAGPAELERYNANYVGGDINGGLAALRQLLFRPVVRRDPYATPDPQIFLCSSSTPPGGGVHGMCGYWAARSALQRLSR